MPPKYSNIACSVEIDDASMEAAKRELRFIPDGIGRAIDGAINKTLAKAKTMVIKQLTADLTAKQSAIRATPGGKERITTTPAYGSSGHLRIMGRRIGAINFKIKKSGDGYVVQYFKTGGTGVSLPGAFKGVGASGNLQLFERFGGGKLTRFLVNKGKHRVTNPHYQGNKNRMMQSLGALHGLSLYDVYKGDSRWSTEVENFMTADVKQQLLSQTDRLLGRSKSERN